jgi:hypothetical protein
MQVWGGGSSGLNPEPPARRTRWRVSAERQGQVFVIAPALAGIQ